MATKQVPHMNGGLGETSYANNSLLQKKVMVRARPVLEESIKKLCSSITLPNCFKFADLGCSSGKNAFLVASDIINIVHETSRKLKLDTPTFQFFLNDLFENDFNTLFKSLREFYHTQKQDKGEKLQAPTCYINATPGSFYDSLFPSNSIHFFHSSYSLHWLSQAPERVRGEAKSPLKTEDVYTMSIYPPSHIKQFKEDFRLFLKSRSKELVPGGAMFLTFVGRFDVSDFINAPGLFRLVVHEMVSQNLIEEAELECFSMPIYQPTAEEAREIIKEEGSFSVEGLESIKTSWDGTSLDEDGSEYFGDDNERADFIAKYTRASMEPILKAHFGEEVMDELFLRFQNKLVQLMEKLVYPTLVISLIKK